MHSSDKPLTAKDVSIPAGHWLGKLPVIGLVLAVVGLGASAGLGMRDHGQFYFSYLVAYMYWLSIALGALFFVIIQYATKAGWSVVVRRVAEVFIAAIPYLVVLFVPIVFGMHTLYHHWVDHDVVAKDTILQGKQAYLNPTFFLIRAAIYLIVWAALAHRFFRGSTDQDKSGDPTITAKLTTFSYPAIALFGISVTFAAFDWLMSLDPHWYSTIFGVYFFAGCLVSSFAAMIVLAHLLNGQNLMGGVVTAEHMQDLGKLMFAFIVFWTYIAFSQYMLIWYANIPEETVWYRHRGHGGWELVSLGLAIGHFAIPFFFFMSRHMKRNRVTAVAAATWMLIVHFVDLHWLVMPVHHEELHFSIIDLTTLLGVGGVFLFAMGRVMNRHALVPVQDPRLHESLAFENM